MLDLELGSDEALTLKRNAGIEGALLTWQSRGIVRGRHGSEACRDAGRVSLWIVLYKFGRFHLVTSVAEFLQRPWPAENSGLREGRATRR